LFDALETVVVDELPVAVLLAPAPPVAALPRVHRVEHVA